MCISAMKSMTDAQRARRALRASQIPCDIVNLDRGITKRGCAYGVSYMCHDKLRVQTVLERIGLDYGETFGE